MLDNLTVPEIEEHSMGFEGKRFGIDLLGDEYINMNLLNFNFFNVKKYFLIPEWE